ncbi:MAG: vitamin B12 dependent-methionine synthase activation domain-containing protein [Phocaeicola sp.]|uniref:vitamin B12 dependent-methionine synthase activation domain-containing protein n=1 Tax=Phocaeicola sp. TaxID=2773926 RepID=UPI003F9EC7CF
MIRHFQIHEVSDYIHWIYFFHAWGFTPKFAGIADIHECDACRMQWIHSFPLEEQSKAAEASNLYREAVRMLNELDRHYHTHGIFILADANSDGDDLILNDIRLPLLRQQSDNSDFLCLSDFVRPLSSGIKDQVGVFATTIDAKVEHLFDNDDYKRLLVQVLCDRLTEATAECFHEQIRKSVWGYAPDEHLTIDQLHKEEYQGIRPAVGYPSMPDVSSNFIIDQLIDMKQIGIHLTENGMMQPHASVSGLMFAHPKAHYFEVGKIGMDQLEDYARRKEVSTEQAKKYLANNL